MTGALEAARELLRPYYLKWFYFPLHADRKPAAWNDCWRFPCSPLPPGPAGIAEGGARPDILFLPMTDWHARIQRAQHLSRELARMGHRVFYLNLNLGREYRRPARGARPMVCRLEENVWELHVPLAREPVYHHRLLDPEESQTIVEAVDALGEAFRISRLALISQFPVWNGAATLLRERYHGPLLYDCHDFLPGFPRIAPEILAAEKQLYQQADMIVFSAQSLMDRILAAVPSLAAKSRVIRNGVAVSHFQVVEGGRRTARPIVGYAGALDEWFDIEAVAAAARRLPGCDFVFLGRVENRRVLELERLPNVRFYGEIPYDRLPGYMAEFDCALIPFQVNELTLATNPIKLYEYFSCGLPVVSSRLPEVELYGDLVYLAGTPAEFAGQVAAAVGENDPERQAARRQIAEQESWTSRASALARELAGGGR